uniref:DNA primase family protein n=1 Tax=Acetatifactor sp. TaxID=1872090 RepID=UPI004057B485
MQTKNQIIDEETKKYIENMDMDNIPSPHTIEYELINEINERMLLENQIRPKGAKLRMIDTLDHDPIAQLMLATHTIVNVNCGGEGSDPQHDLLAIYMEEGESRGTYSCFDNDFARIALQYNRRMSAKQLQEVQKRLRLDAPRVERCMDRDLIAVNNGIFNYKTKELQEFTPELVFLSKSHVNYNHAAQNVVIHNHEDGTDWDVESWMESLSDDPEIVELLWQILGAIVRPFVDWNQSAWLYSETGNNGKGTLCELMRSLVGASAYAAIPLCDFSKEFALEPLTRAAAIITDENDVGTYVDKAANLKSVITNDAIYMNRKFQSPISYKFYGFMVQCLNEFPRVKDKSNSFYRRQLFIPFCKCFTGKERKYIKRDYLRRPEVLEYCLHKVLHMNYYELTYPDACKEVIDRFKEFNDPVRQCWNELRDEFKWDLLPYKFLYELFQSWFRKNNPHGKMEGKQKFIMDLQAIIQNDDEWDASDTDERTRSGGRMNWPEPLISEYELVEWKNPYYTGGDPNRANMPKLADSYAGLVRRRGRFCGVTE